MNIHDIYDPFLRHFRAQRVAACYRRLAITPRTRVLDVGGSPFFWILAEEIGLPRVKEVVVLNTYQHPEVTLPSNIRWILGDGCAMPFDRREFDVIFCNSVIEHLGRGEKQGALATEIRRVSKSYWVQTPDPRFFVEPHYITPFVHWWPKPIQRRLVRNFTLWGLVTRPTKQEVDGRLAEIRLISRTELHSLLPDSNIITERFCGMPKSLIAFRK